MSISVNKTNKSYIDKIYNRGLCAISWYCGVINLNKKEQTNLIKDFNEQITKALNSKDSDFIQQELKTKTNSKYFLELRKLILNDEDKFLSLKLDTTDKLSKEDVAKDNPIIEAIEALRSFSPFCCNGNNFAFEVYSLGSPTAIIMPTTIPHTVTIAKKRFFDHTYLHKPTKSNSFPIFQTNIIYDFNFYGYKDTN